MITEERLKYFEKEQHVTLLLETAFIMQKSGKLTSIASTGLTTIQVKVNNGTYVTPSFPLAYSASDVLWFNFSYTDQTLLQGNLIINGKDN